MVTLGQLLGFGVTALVIIGAVMMKITSSTSITSTMGVTLMSLIIDCCRWGLKLPKAMPPAYLLK